MLRRLTPPLRGAADNTTLIDTPEMFCPPDNLRNVRAFGDGTDGRPRFGPRPGIIKAFERQLGNGAAIQALAVVGRASGISGYETGTVTPVDGGITRTSGTISGHAWVLGTNHGMHSDFGAGTTRSVYSLSWHPTLRRFCYVNLSGTPVKSNLYYVDSDPDSATYLQTLWTAEVPNADPGGTPTLSNYANAILVTATFVYLCAAGYLYVLRTSDGVYIKRYSCSGWAQGTMRAVERPDGRIAVLFSGSPTIRGPVTTNSADTGNGNGEGSDFRAGVMLFTVDTTQTDVDDSPLTVTQFGTKRTATAVTIDNAAWTAATKRLVKTGAFTSYTHATGNLINITAGTGVTAGAYLIAAKISADEIELVGSIKATDAADVDADQLQPAWYEDHQYFRFSERGFATPRGYIPSSMCALSDGSLVVARCNKGWGPNNSFRPDESVPPLSLCRITGGTTGAALLWETDIGSRLDLHPVTISGSPVDLYNDRPHPSDAVNTPNDPHPTCDAICADGDDNVYVAGQLNGDGYSVRKVRSSDGQVLWEQSTGGWAPQHAIAYHAAENVVVVVGQRNSAWPDAGGANAVVWFIDAFTGDIVDTFDLGGAVTAFGVDISAAGDIAFVTSYLA